jgi:hypothetical protein
MGQAKGLSMSLKWLLRLGVRFEPISSTLFSSLRAKA